MEEHNEEAYECTKGYSAYDVVKLFHKVEFIWCEMIQKITHFAENIYFI